MTPLAPASRVAVVRHSARASLMRDCGHCHEPAVALRVRSFTPPCRVAPRSKRKCNSSQVADSGHSRLLVLCSLFLVPWPVESNGESNKEQGTRNRERESPFLGEREPEIGVG